MKTTVIIILKSPNGQYIRDTREARTSDLIQVLNVYLSKGYEIIAIEELEGSILDFYTKRLSDDDIDAMAASDADSIL